MNKPRYYTNTRTGERRAITCLSEFLDIYNDNQDRLASALGECQYGVTKIGELALKNYDKIAKMVKSHNKLVVFSLVLGGVSYLQYRKMLKRIDKLEKESIGTCDDIEDIYDQVDDIKKEISETKEE